jgi:hypothetical protein
MAYKKVYIAPAIEEVEMDTMGMLASSTLPQSIDGDSFDILPETNEAYGGEFC